MNQTLQEWRISRYPNGAASKYANTTINPSFYKKIEIRGSNDSMTNEIQPMPGMPIGEIVYIEDRAFEDYRLETYRKTLKKEESQALSGDDLVLLTDLSGTPANKRITSPIEEEQKEITIEDISYTNPALSPIEEKKTIEEPYIDGGRETGSAQEERL